MAINKNEGLEDLKKNGWVPFSKQKYEIKDDAGNTVGTIGYKAAKALNNNKLFDYDPQNDEERKVFSYLRQRHNRESRKREQREYYASIPYRKIDDISKSTDLSKSEKEKQIDETVEKYSRSGQKRENLKKYAEEKKPDSFVSWLGKNAMNGLSQFNKQAISTLDYILPTEFLGKYVFISKANDYYKKESERYADEAQKSSVSRGKGWTTGGELVSGTVNALPNAIMAFMSAGASLGASAAPTLTNTAAASSSILSKIGQSAKEMVQNPSYWTSVLQTLGTDYEDAKERGADDFTAATTAILTTALNAGIEVGGGTEVLPKKLKEGSKNAVLDWVKSSLEEGGEEVVQGITTNAMAKLMYDRNAPIFSTTDENAVVNPVNLSKEFGMGAAVGGILGGGQIGAAQGINKGINYADNQTIGKRALSVSQPDVLINRAIDAGLESSDEKTVGRIQKLADKYKSGNASAAEVGEIVKTGLRTGYEQGQNLKVTEDTQTNDDVALPTQDTARQSVLAAANSGNSESSVISPSVTAAANVSERQMHDVKENLSEGGAVQSVEQVQNAVKKVTNTMINEFKNSNIKNIPNYQAAYDENLRLSTTKGATIDKDFIKTYASQYAEGLKRNNSKAYKELASVSDDVGSILTDYLISNRIPQGVGDISALAQAGGELRSIVGKAAQTTLAMNGKIYNDTDRVSAISNEIANGNFAVVDGANDGNIALAKVGEYYEAYGADAVALAKAFGVSTHYIQKNGRKTLVAAVPSKYIGEYAAKSGYSGTQYSAGGNEYIYLTKGAERGNLSADAVRSDITAESDSDFIAEIEKNGVIELDERPSESKIETIAAQVERDNTIPVYLDGVDKLGEVLLVYANEEDVTRNMVKTDINSYYDGVMPERGIPLSENTDRHYDEDTIEISERPSEYDADSYALVVELDRTIPILLNGVDELGEVELNYSNEENVTRDMVKSDIDAYYSGTMPEHGVSLSNNYDPDIKFSVESVDGTDKKYVKADRQVISGDNPEEWRKQVYNYINSSIRKGKDINVLSADGDVLTITEDTAGKARFRNTIREPNGNLRKMTNEEFAVKLRAESHIDEIAEVSKKNGYSAIDTKNHHFAKDGFYYRTAYFEDFDGKYYKLTLSVGKSGEINTVYNVGKLKETYGRARDSKVVEQKPNNARRGFSDEAVPFKTASETNIGLRGGTPSDNTNISQNDDIVNSNIRENSENDTENVKFSQDISLDGGGNIRYNDDIDIPYRESKQLREYIMSENNRNGSRLKPFGYKEIGDNFYFWRNNSKTDYDVIAQVEIDGNEDIIDLLRKGLENGKTYGIDKGAKGFNDWLTAVRSGQRSDSGNNAVDTAELSNGNDDRLYSRQSSDDDGIKFDRESNRNQQNTEVGNYGRDDILNGNDRRTFGESERERGSGVQEITGDASGNASEEQSSASTRGIYARDVKEAGGVERRNDRGVEADFVKSEYYNDEMRRIAAENDERGVVTHFILGNGRAIEYGTNFRGAVRGNEVYIQADHGKYSPTQINRHEIIHRNYSSDTVQTLKNRIKSRLTNEQIRDIAESLYRDYAQKRRSFDEIFEEFVCDVMADMNDYAEMFETEVRNYWAAEEQDRKGYSPSTYTESIDAGGKNVAENKIEPLAWNSDKKSVHPINAFGSDNTNISQNSEVVNNDSANAEFSRQVDSWKDRSMDKNEVFNLGNTPDVLKNIGADGLPIIMTQKVMNKITGGKHDIDLSEIKRLPQSIAEPIMIFKSATTPNAYVILTELSDKNSNSVVAALHLNRTQKHIAVNRIASVYGKENIENFVDRQIKAGNLIFADKNKSQQWSQSRGLQLPKLADTIADNNNISQNDNIVKSSIRKNSENDTDIRFSVDENEDMSYLSEPVKNIRNDINEVINRADLKKGGKVYDRAAAVKVRDSILDNISIGDIQGIDMRTKKDRAVMTVLVNRALNSAGVDAKRKSARDLTRYIAQNASVYDADSLCADGGVDYEGDRAVILNYIKHGVKISPDAKEAIISAVGENSAKGYIAVMSNNSALGIDSVYDELSVALPGYFTSDALTEGEKMRRVIDVYTWLKDGKSMQDVKLIDVMTPDDARAFTELVQKQLELAFDTMGRDSAISREIAAERTKYEQRLNDIRERYEVKIADMRSSAKKKQSDGAKAKNISTEQTGNRFKNLAEAAKKYGAIKKGANAVRDIEMPKRIDDNRYVSRFARTMAEAGVTPDESLSEFERDILDGKMTYERITDEEAKKSATDKIMRRGFMQALDGWNEMIRSNQRIGKNEMALGQTLYNQCINAKDAQNAMKIAADLANIATQAGQTVQACTLIKQMSPDCQLYSLEQSVEKMKNEFENKRKFVSGEKRKIDLKINEELAQKLLNAKTEDERRAVMDEILQDIANQIPSTLKDKWDSWRYLSMLGNPRTHIRNIGGNAVFMLPVKVKNAVGWVLEKSISKDKRTKALKSTKDSKNFAAADYIKMKDIIQGNSGKYEELSKINELRRIYKFKPLEALRKANFAALEWEDGIFLKQHYVNAMSQFLTARGYTSEFMNSGTKEAATALENARAYAMNEAQKATYRDANAIAETLSRWQRNLQNNDKLGVRVVGQAVEGIVPFKKTPLNIAKRGVEYSPIGLISGLYDAAANIKSGKVTAAQAIDKIASGLTGTGLVILGMGLSKLGLVKGDDDDDDKLARLDSATGEQSYSFKIGNHSYTIDWVAPASMPFFMGVSMQNAFDKTDKFTFEETLNAVLKIPAPLLNLSVLSSLNDLIRAGDYSSTPTEKMADYAWQATTSYVGQAFPTVMGQIARTVDKTKRNASFTDPDNGLPAGLDRFIARQATKIPGLSKILEPKIDMWGREETYGDTWYGRLIGNTISPGYYKEINSTVLDDELRRLGNEYEGDGSVLPPKNQKSFTFEKQEYFMNPSEYAQYSVIRGQKSFEYADELIRTDDYKNKSAEEKKKALEKCYDAAGDEAKNEILKGRGIDVAAKEAEKAAKKKSKKKTSKKKKK